MPRFPLATTICLTLFPLISSAEDPSTNNSISLMNSEFKLPTNSRWREERIMTAPRLSLSVDLGTEKNVKGSMSMLSRQLLDIDVISPTDLRLKFVQNNTTSDIDFGNNRSRQTTTLPLDGKNVLAKLSDDGRWIAKFEGQRRPTPEESSSLNSLTYLWASGIYPDREINIGESWQVDAKNFKNLFGSDFENPSGNFEFTLTRIVDHQGQACAKITGKGNLISQTKTLSNNTATADQTPLDAKIDITIEIFRSIELAMDLTIEMKGTLELSNEKDKTALTYKASSPVEFTRKFRRR